MKKWYWINKCTKNSFVINIRHQSLYDNRFLLVEHDKGQACNELTLRIIR